MFAFRWLPLLAALLVMTGVQLFFSGIASAQYCCMCGDDCPQPPGTSGPESDCECCNCPEPLAMKKLEEACFRELNREKGRLIVKIDGYPKQVSIKARDIKRFTGIESGACGALELVREKFGGQNISICENFKRKSGTAR